MRKLLAVLVFFALATTACQGRSQDPRSAKRKSSSASTTVPKELSCPDGREHAPGQSEQKLATGGKDRTYLLYVPTGYTGQKPVPIVFNFHGYGSSAAQQIVYGDFRGIADRETFLIVAPDGQGATRHFNLFGASADEADDVAFTMALLDHLQARLCIDAKRVYSTGMSNGGAISSVLACRASDRIAAVGPVAVVLYVPACTDAKRPVPIAGFMGTADAVVPFDGGKVNCCGNPTIPGALESMANFASHHQCASTPTEERPSPMVLHRKWSGCAQGSAVEFYAIEGGGHTWPGSPIEIARLGPTTKEISASETLWAFFRDHPMD